MLRRSRNPRRGKPKTPNPTEKVKPKAKSLQVSEGCPQEDDEVEFKSDDEFYWKEKEGLKANTMRAPDMDDERFCKLDVWWEHKKYGRIKIVHSKKPKEFFVRQITDITYYRGWCIISWNQERHCLLTILSDYKGELERYREYDADTVRIYLKKPRKNRLQIDTHRRSIGRLNAKISAIEEMMKRLKK